MTIGDSSLLDLNSGSLFNYGTVRRNASPSAQPATPYTPILAGSWSGTGTIQPLGGTWNTSNHTFTPSIIATGTASEPLSIDRSQRQRLQLTNPQTFSTIIANVASTTTSSSFTLAANPLTSEQAAQLQATLPTSSPVFSAWTFNTTGYTTGDPVYLSLSLPSGLTAKNLSLYGYNGTTWSLFTPFDFSYDGTYASFTSTDLLGYALSTTALPLPGDATLDGKVDAFDLNLLAAHWQNPTGSLWQNGDFTGDGKIDAFDLNTLAANWQSGAGGADLTALTENSEVSTQNSVLPIPEPASAALLALAATSLLIRRRPRDELSRRTSEAPMDDAT